MKRSTLLRRGLVGLAVALAAALPAAAGAAEDMGSTPRAPQVLSRLAFTGRRNLLALATANARRLGDPVVTPRAAGVPAGGGAQQVVDMPGAVAVPFRDGQLEPTPPSGGATLPNPPARAVDGTAPQFSGFAALSGLDSTIANNKALVSEPPDQGLCVGGGRVVEAVNSALTVYNSDASGVPLLPPIPIGKAAVSFNDLFGLAPTRSLNPDVVFTGPVLFDPTCHFDQDVGRFFLVVSGEDLDPTGTPTGRARLYLAVTASADPLGQWATFTLDTSPADRFVTGCPCVDDFPHVGTDASGFFITSNRAAQNVQVLPRSELHAMSKRALARAAAAKHPTAPKVVTVLPDPTGGVSAITVQPAITPPGAEFPPNREYFLSTTDVASATPGSDHRVVVWALSNTQTLDRRHPHLDLVSRVIDTLPYALPSVAVQKPGPFPLGESLGEPLSAIDAGLDWVPQTPVFVAGHLWAAISTAVASTPAEGPRTGILWLNIDPSPTSGGEGRIDDQGYVTIQDASLLYPAIGLNPSGQGVMVFSVAGPSRYPSAAYIAMGDEGPQGPVRIVGAGQAPEDGFSCYTFGVSEPAPCRWGDYSAAAVDEHGAVWIATEHIGPGSRILPTNWDTFVGRLEP